MAHNLNLLILKNYQMLTEIKFNSLMVNMFLLVILVISQFSRKSQYNIYYIFWISNSMCYLFQKVTKELGCVVDFFPDFYIFQELLSEKVMELVNKNMVSTFGSPRNKKAQGSSYILSLCIIFVL